MGQDLQKSSGAFGNSYDGRLPKSGIKKNTMDVYWSSDIFLDPEDSDLEAHVQIQDKSVLVIPVHGFVLIESSEVFKTMLLGQLKKGVSRKVIQIKAPGDEADAITFFRYLYTRKLGNLDISSYTILAQMAHLYKIECLLETCEKRIRNIVTPLSACRVCWALEKVASEELLLLCKSMILKHAFLIFIENLHVVLNEETMRFLLESQELNVLDEEQALTALWMWARANCLLETTSEETFSTKLDKFTHLIRWPKIQSLGNTPWPELVKGIQKSSIKSAKPRKNNHAVSLEPYLGILDLEATEPTERQFQHLRKRHAMQDFWAFNLFLNPENSDFSAHIETHNSDENLVIPVHSFVLKKASDVFKAMLQKDQFKEGMTKEIEIKFPGTQEDAITFFRFLYTKKLGEVGIRSLIALVQVAHLYEIRSLFEICEKRIAMAMTPLSVCRVYGLLENIASESILMQCKVIMLKYAFLIFVENLHTGLNKETMKFLLQSDELILVNEEQALVALWVWHCTNILLDSTVSEKKMKNTLENHIHLIRWPLIKNVDLDAPWFYLFEKNKNLDVLNVKLRGSSQTFSLKPFSNMVVLLENVDFQKNTIVSGSSEMEIDISSDVLLTGVTMRVQFENRSFLGVPKFIVNNCNISKDISYTEEFKGYVTSTKMKHYTLMFDFIKPVLLSSIHSNKIVVVLDYDGCVFPTCEVKRNIQSTSLSTGRDLDFMIHSKVIGFEKVFYILAK